MFWVPEIWIPNYLVSGYHEREVFYDIQHCFNLVFCYKFIFIKVYLFLIVN